MRGFNSAKLYKLVKIAAFVVSAILILFSLSGFWSIPIFSNESIKFVHDICKDPKDGDCLLAAWSTVGEIQGRTLKMLGMGIALPILFFVGTWLYKYLFPEEKR